MSNKLDKRTNCLYCDKALEAKYRSKKFCDDKCRIYWNRENKAKKTPPTDKKETKKVAPENMSRIEKMLWESEQEILNQNKK